MAKAEKVDKGKCMFKYNSGAECERSVQGRGLCNTHYQKALKTIAANEEGTLINPKSGKPFAKGTITWDTLVKRGKAKDANRNTGQDYFLVD